VSHHLNKQVIDMAWELSILEDWGCQDTDTYKAMKERFFKLVNTVRRLRGSKPMDQEEYEQKQLERVLHGNRYASSNKSNL